MERQRRLLYAQQDHTRMWRPGWAASANVLSGRGLGLQNVQKNTARAAVLHGATACSVQVTLHTHTHA